MDEKFGDVPTLRGRLNIYTMETGDGREIELSVVDKYICWRRVNDVEWVQLAPLSSFIPVKGEDYWSDEDQKDILEYVESKIGNNILHENISGRDNPDQHSIESITNLRSELDTKVSKVTEFVSGDLVTVDSDGNLTGAGVRPSELVRSDELRDNYVTKSELSEYSDHSTDTYATKDELLAHVSESSKRYAAKEELVDYATVEDLSSYTALEKFNNYRETVEETYSRKEELDEHIDRAVETLATKAELADYATKTDLGDYTTKVEFLQHLEYSRASLATREELADYATKDELANYPIEEELENYATKEDLLKHSIESDEVYATKDSLSTYTPLNKLSEYTALEKFDNYRSKVEETYATKEELAANSQVCDEKYATKEELEDCTNLESLSSTLSEYAKKEYVESLISESIQGTVTVKKSGETVVNIPDDLRGYMNFYVYHNGMLLVRDIHYTASEDSITLLNHITYAGDIFSFVYVGSVLSSETVHYHENQDVLEKITQGDIDKWNSSNSVEVFKVNGSEVPIVDKTLDITVPTTPEDVGAAPSVHTHEEYVQSASLFNANGIILPSLLPSSLGNIVEVKEYSELPAVGDAKTLYIVEDENRTYRWSGSRYVPLDLDDTLTLGETSDTAFRGDHGVIAYEHALESHAPPTAQENVVEVFKINGVTLPVADKTVNIPIASFESLGVVKSSNDADKIRINEDGTMSLNKVSFSNLVNTGEELLLYSGGALS